MVESTEGRHEFSEPTPEDKLKAWQQWVDLILQRTESASLREFSPDSNQDLVQQAPNPEEAERFLRLLSNSIEFTEQYNENWHKNFDASWRDGDIASYLQERILNILEQRWLQDAGKEERSKRWYYRYGQIAQRFIQDRGLMRDDWVDEISKTPKRDEAAGGARMYIVGGYEHFATSKLPSLFPRNVDQEDSKPFLEHYRQFQDGRIMREQIKKIFNVPPPDESGRVYLEGYGTNQVTDENLKDWLDEQYFAGRFKRAIEEFKRRGVELGVELPTS